MYYRAGRDGLDHEGVCILVRDHVGHASLPLRTPLQAVAVRCHLGCQYTICSLYIPLNTPVPLHELEDLIRQLTPPFLLLGDFNACSPVWETRPPKTWGNLLKTFLHRDFAVF